MMVFKVCVHVNYEDAKKEFFKQYPELETDENVSDLDFHVYEFICVGPSVETTPSIRACLSPKVDDDCFSEIWKMFISWLKSKNILLNKEKEIYLDV